MKFAGIIIAILFLLITGCGKKQNYPGPEKSKTDQNANGISLPADYPSEFPVLPNARVLSVNISGDGTTVMFQVEMPAAGVMQEYRKTAILSGYEETVPELKGNENSTRLAVSFTRKKDNRNITISAASGRNGISTVSFVYR